MSTSLDSHFLPFSDTLLLQLLRQSGPLALSLYRLRLLEWQLLTQALNLLLEWLEIFRNTSAVLLKLGLKLYVRLDGTALKIGVDLVDGVSEIFVMVIEAHLYCLRHSSLEAIANVLEHVEFDAIADVYLLPLELTGTYVILARAAFNLSVNRQTFSSTCQIVGLQHLLLHETAVESLNSLLLNVP